MASDTVLKHMALLLQKGWAFRPLDDQRILVIAPNGEWTIKGKAWVDAWAILWGQDDAALKKLAQEKEVIP